MSFCFVPSVFAHCKPSQSVNKKGCHPHFAEKNKQNKITAEKTLEIITVGCFRSLPFQPGHVLHCLRSPKRQYLTDEFSSIRGFWAATHSWGGFTNCINGPALSCDALLALGSPSSECAHFPPLESPQSISQIVSLTCNSPINSPRSRRKCRGEIYMTS